MALKGWSIARIEPYQAEPFIREWHYSGSMNGVICDFCFGLFAPGFQIKGAAIFGRMAMARQWEKYANDPSKVIELRRLALIDDTPKNAESFFIARCIRWLEKNTDFQLIVSYSDLDFGHIGTIYKASNFQLIGTTAKGRIIFWNGQRFHDKAIRTKYKGRLKPFAQRLSEALQSGDAVYLPTLGKNVFIYRLKKRKPVTLKQVNWLADVEKGER